MAHYSESPTIQSPLLSMYNKCDSLELRHWSINIAQYRHKSHYVAKFLDSGISLALSYYLGRHIWARPAHCTSSCIRRSRYIGRQCNWGISVRVVVGKQSGEYGEHRGYMNKILLVASQEQEYRSVNQRHQSRHFHVALGTYVHRKVQDMRKASPGATIGKRRTNQQS